MYDHEGCVTPDPSGKRSLWTTEGTQTAPRECSRLRAQGPTAAYARLGGPTSGNRPTGNAGASQLYGRRL